MDSSEHIKPLNGQRCEILIPVFNGYESVRRCLDSVLAHSPPDCAIRILDDASSDLRLLGWLDALESHEPRVSVTHADENLGFVGNVNRGLASATGDVILLNSDTVVTPGWVEKLLACAASDPRIALVCPLSNNATILSVPRANADDPIADGLGIERFGALVESVSARRYPRLPVAVGFCMLIRRPALQRLGLLHRAYHRGYGEECDYSLRAWEAGFEVVCCDDTFVYHEGEQSFGTVAGMEGVKRRNESVLLARWPFYHALVRRFCRLDPLRDVRERVLTGLARARGDHAPHILQLLHSYHTLGGTELHSRALVEGLSETYRTTVLFPDEIGSYQDYHCVVDHEWFRVLAYRRDLTEGRPRLFGQVAALRNAVVEASFARLVAGGQVALVHVQHLLHWGTLELPLIARRLGAVVVLSLHDYFLFCPVFDMLRPDGRPCGKARAEADDPECLYCLARQSSTDETADARRLYLRERHTKLLEVFAAADALVSPSHFVLERFRRAYGDALAARVRVVPHGLPALGRAPKPSRGPRFRLGVFANLSRRKGADRLLEMVELLKARRDLEILQFGSVDPAYQASLDAAGVRRQGVYRLQDLARLAAGVDLALVPSIYEETFCLTIAELQALGVPVLAFGVGAIPERIQDGVTGFLVAESSARALAERIERLIASPESLRQVRGATARASGQVDGEQCAGLRRTLCRLTGAARRSPACRSERDPGGIGIRPCGRGTGRDVGRAPGDARAELGAPANGLRHAGLSALAGVSGALCAALSWPGLGRTVRAPYGDSGVRARTRSHRRHAGVTPDRRQHQERTPVSGRQPVRSAVLDAGPSSIVPLEADRVRPVRRPSHQPSAGRVAGRLDRLDGRRRPAASVCARSPARSCRQVARVASDLYRRGSHRRGWAPLSPRLQARFRPRSAALPVLRR
ncbi:glycosyltransferase [Allochromatium tepidum]|uniref:glycosyltransferase n=1 Tax=Allochromatium tepidum TaxID=553982 RepID=UPI001BD018CC|nr:glycosyltransferase [Allochromatium tepidum]